MTPATRRTAPTALIAATPEISVVVPIYNEEESIPQLYERLTTELEKLGKPKVVTEPGYRRVDTRLTSHVEACMLLAAALLPFALKYPLPAIEVAA